MRNKKHSINNNPQSEIPNPQLAHVPVLLHEAVDLLAPKAGGLYVDGTLGAGGHAAEILKRSAPDGVLIGMDQDADAVERCRKNLAPYGDRVIIRQANYRDLPEVLSELGLRGCRRGPARPRHVMVPPEDPGARLQLHAGRSARYAHGHEQARGPPPTW